MKKCGREIIVVLLSALGLILGIIGFDSGFSNELYDTLRLFLLNHQFGQGDFLLSCPLEIARWLIFIAFLLFIFKLFVTIIAPRFFQSMKIWFRYHNHIVICGLNKITLNLVEKYEKGDKKIRF